MLACRRNLAGGNVRGSLGLPIPGTSLRVVDPQTLESVEAGCQGLVLARGPGVMQVRSQESSTRCDLAWQHRRRRRGPHVAAAL